MSVSIPLQSKKIIVWDLMLDTRADSMRFKEEQWNRSCVKLTITVLFEDRVDIYDSQLM